MREIAAGLEVCINNSEQPYNSSGLMVKEAAGSWTAQSRPVQVTPLGVRNTHSPRVP